jgi:hypothetical protein
MLFTADGTWSSAVALGGWIKFPQHFLSAPTPTFYYSADVTAKVSMTAAFCIRGAFQD